MLWYAKQHAFCQAFPDDAVYSLFQALDVDHSGLIDRAELLRFAQRGPSALSARDGPSGFALSDGTLPKYVQHLGKGQVYSQPRCAGSGRRKRLGVTLVRLVGLGAMEAHPNGAAQQHVVVLRVGDQCVLLPWAQGEATRTLGSHPRDLARPKGEGTEIAEYWESFAFTILSADDEIAIEVRLDERTRHSELCRTHRGRGYLRALVALWWMWYRLFGATVIRGECTCSGRLSTADL